MTYPVINGGIINIDSFTSDTSLISSDGSGNLTVSSLLLSNTTVLSYDSTSKIMNFASGLIGTTTTNPLPTTDPNNVGQWWNKDGYVTISGFSGNASLFDVLIYNSTSTELYFHTSNFIFSKNLPVTDPGVNGQLWNNGGVLCISNGTGTIPTSRTTIINSVNFNSDTSVLSFSDYSTVYFDTTFPTSDPGVNGQLWNNGGVLCISVSSTENTVTKSGSSDSCLTTDDDTLSSLIITASSIFFDSLSTTLIQQSGRLWNNGGTVGIAITGERKRLKTKMTISSDGQSTYTFPFDYSENVDIFLNGLLVDEDNYSTSGNNTIILGSSITTTLTTSDILYFILYL